MDAAARLRSTLVARLNTLEERAGRRCHGDEDGRFEQERDAAAMQWREDEPGKNDEEENVYVYVSSAARDQAVWPSPSQYQVSLVAELDNVVEASVVQASFPLTFATVEAGANTLAFSFAPFAAVSTVTVPPGTYTGDALALELMTQMNQSVYAGSIPAPFTMDFSTGFVRNALGNLPPGNNQFRVQYDDNRSLFRFQLVNDQQLAQNAPAFALHALKFGGDIFAQLGFPPAQVAAQGVSSGAYYYLTNQGTTAFSTAASVDQRYAYSVYSTAVADLSGPCALVLDVPQLNDNDLALISSASSAFNVGACLGLVYTKQPAYLSDRTLEFNNSSYPIKKTYRAGRARIQALNVNIRRVNGALVDFRGADHCFTLRLVVKRTQPLKPIFTR